MYPYLNDKYKKSAIRVDYYTRKNVLIQLNLLKFTLRCPHRRVVSFWTVFFDLSLNNLTYLPSVSVDTTAISREAKNEA